MDAVLFSVTGLLFRVLHACFSESWHGFWVLADESRVSARRPESAVLSGRLGGVWLQPFVAVLTDQSLLLTDQSLLLTDQSLLLTGQSRVLTGQSRLHPGESRLLPSQPSLLALPPEVLPYLPVLLPDDVGVLTEKSCVHSHQPFLLAYDVRVLTSESTVHSHQSFLLAHDVSVLTSESTVHSHQPFLLAHDVGVLTNEPSVLSHQPFLLDHDVGVLTDESSVLSNKSSLLSHKPEVGPLSDPSLPPLSQQPPHLAESVSAVHSVQSLVLTRQSAVDRLRVSCLHPEQPLPQPHVLRPCHLHPQTRGCCLLTGEPRAAALA